MMKLIKKITTGICMAAYYQRQCIIVFLNGAPHQEQRDCFIYDPGQAFSAFQSGRQ